MSKQFIFAAKTSKDIRNISMNFIGRDVPLVE